VEKITTKEFINQRKIFFKKKGKKDKINSILNISNYKKEVRKINNIKK